MRDAGGDMGDDEQETDTALYAGEGADPPGDLRFRDSEGTRELGISEEVDEEDEDIWVPDDDPRDGSDQAPD